MRWPEFINKVWKHGAAAKSSTESFVEPSPETIEIAPHLALGARGERLAAEFLARRGYALVATNFRLPVGRSLRTNQIIRAEIDIVAYDERTLCFVEVKTRQSDWFASPETNVDLRKQRQITRAARAYRRTFGVASDPYRYDVVSVVAPPIDKTGSTPAPRIELLRAFWTEAKFRKRHWSGGVPFDY